MKDKLGGGLQVWHQQAAIKSSRVCSSKLGEEVLKRKQNQTKLQPRGKKLLRRTPDRHLMQRHRLQPQSVLCLLCFFS